MRAEIKKKWFLYKVITHYQVEHSKGGNAGVTRRKTPPEMFKRNFYM